MTQLNEMLAYNKRFVENREYEAYATDKFPNRRMAILTCMDTRLIELLPRALNMRNGDAKVVKSAGAVISHPYDSVMMSLLVAVYELKAEEIFVIGHHGCGMTGLQADQVLQKAKDAGISETAIQTMKQETNVNDWLKGFDQVKDGVLRSMEIIKTHPLLPGNIPVHGLIIDPGTGKLDFVETR